MTIDVIARAVAEEINWHIFKTVLFDAKLDTFTYESASIPSIIARRIAPLAEQLDNLLFLVNSVRKLHRAEELEGSPFTHCRCNVCNYIRSAGEADGKEETP